MKNIALISSLNIDPIEKGPPEDTFPEKIQVPENNEISINYVHTREILDWNKIVIHKVFAFKVTFDITRSDDEIEPQTVKECRHRNDWPIWKESIQTELKSLVKREVFGPIVHKYKGVMLVDISGLLLKNEMRTMKFIQHKAQLVAQGFS